MLKGRIDHKSAKHKKESKLQYIRYREQIYKSVYTNFFKATDLLSSTNCVVLVERVYEGDSFIVINIVVGID